MNLFNGLKGFFSESEPDIPPEHPMIPHIVLLIEAATYDDDFAPEEGAMIRAIMEEKYLIKAEELEELMALCRRKRERVPDIYPFTRQINAKLSNRDRFELMCDIWQVILADDHIDANEEHFARKLQKLLRLDHPTWIEAKLEARKRMPS